MIKMLANYTNGNYNVILLEDGSKFRATGDNDFKPAFAESYDICITKYCDGACSFCYEGCSTNGVHADLSLPFLIVFILALKLRLMVMTFRILNFIISQRE